MQGGTTDGQWTVHRRAGSPQLYLVFKVEYVQDKLGHDILATCGDGRRPDWLEVQTTCAASRTRLGCSLGLHSDVA